MKRQLSFRSFALLLSATLLLTLLLPSVCAVSAQTEGMASVTAVVKTADLSYSNSADDQFRVALDLSLGDAADGIAAYIVTVTWDPSVLQLIASGTDGGYCSFTDRFGDGWTMIPDSKSTFVKADPEKGVLCVSSGSAANRKGSDGALFLLEFKPRKSAVSTEINVTLGSATVSAQAALSSESGTITDVIPSTTLKLSVTAKASKVPGDVNGDGVFNALDFLKAQRAFFGLDKLTETELLAVDFNRNGKVEANECMKLKRAYYGLTAL